MKKNVFSVSAITIIVMVVVMFFAACKKECSSDCIPREPDTIEQVTFSLMNNTSEAEVSILKNVIAGNYRESVYGVTPSEKLFQFFKEYSVSKNLPVHSQTMAFVLYYDLPISQSLSVVDEYIKGISIYNVGGRRIIHRLFVRNEKSEFYEIENVRVPVPGILAGHIHYYLENYVFTDIQNRSSIILAGDFAKKVWKDKQKYRTDPNRVEIKAKASKDIVGGSGLSSNCSKIPECYHINTNGACVHDSSWGWTCDKGSCRATEASGSLSRMIESMFIDLDLMYKFRDDILYNSIKGETYVDNYYYLSEEYKDKVSLALNVQTALFFRDFNPVMTAFLDPIGKQEEIMFDNELTDSLLKLLDKYEAITKSIEGKEILNSIRKDVNNFKNRPLRELLAIFE